MISVDESARDHIPTSSMSQLKYLQEYKYELCHKNILFALVKFIFVQYVTLLYRLQFIYCFSVAQLIVTAICVQVDVESENVFAQYQKYVHHHHQ